MSIKLKLNGFDEMLEKIQAAEKDINPVVQKALKESADIINTDYRAAMTASGVASDLINRMPTPELESNGNTFRAHVGYKKGAYVPNDISDGFKAIFL